MAGVDDERIRARAHEIWESEGRPEGRDREHWEQAFREMSGGDATAANTGANGGVSQIGANVGSTSDVASGPLAGAAEAVTESLSVLGSGFGETAEVAADAPAAKPARNRKRRTAGA